MNDTPDWENEIIAEGERELQLHPIPPRPVTPALDAERDRLLESAEHVPADALGPELAWHNVIHAAHAFATRYEDAAAPYLEAAVYRSGGNVPAEEAYWAATTGGAAECARRFLQARMERTS